MFFPVMQDIWKTVFHWCDNFATAENLLATCKSVRINVSKNDVRVGHVRRSFSHYLFHRPFKKWRSGVSDQNCLKWFIKKGCSEIVHHLINSKVSIPNQALEYSCFHGDDKVVKVLLEHGAIVDRCVYEYAVDHTNVLYLLLEHEKEVPEFVKTHSWLLRWTIQRGHYEAVDSILKYGAKVESIFQDDTSNLLVRACNLGDIRTVQVLLENNVQTEWSLRECLQVMSRSKLGMKTKIVRLLLDHGAKY
jgi:ankyrin repeat protein